MGRGITRQSATRNLHALVQQPATQPSAPAEETKAKPKLERQKAQRNLRGDDYTKSNKAESTQPSSSGLGTVTTETRSEKAPRKKGGLKLFGRSGAKKSKSSDGIPHGKMTKDGELKLSSKERKALLQDVQTMKAEVKEHKDRFNSEIKQKYPDGANVFQAGDIQEKGQVFTQLNYMLGSLENELAGGSGKMKLDKTMTGVLNDCLGRMNEAKTRTL